MRHCVFAASKYLLFFILVFCACTNRLSEVSIYSNLQEGDSVSVALYSRITDQYHTVNWVSVTSTDADRNRINISLPDSLIRNIGAFAITIHSHSDGIFAISSLRVKGYGTIYPQDIMNTLWWQSELMLDIDSKSNTIKSHINKNIPGTFPIGIGYNYRHHPTGFQLFLRLFLLATLLILTFILTIKSSTHRFLLFTIALFFASLLLKIDYTNYTMGVMTLTMIIAFIYNKSHRFTWQPIFYVLCSMYLINIIGLLYTGDFYQGIKRLDTSAVLIVFPVVFSMIQFPKKNIILLLRFFVWTVIFFCGFSLLSYFTIVPEFSRDMVFLKSRLYTPLLMMWPAHPHPSYLSTILLMAIPVALYLRYQDEKQITLIGMLLCVLLPIAFAVLSGARVGMIIAPMLLVLGYFFYCKFRPAFKWGLVVVGIAAGGILLHLFPKADDHFVDPNRADLRKTAISAIKEKPVFGWGTGYVEPLIHSEERAHSLGIETPYDFNQFHNQYLEDMVQFGAPGILILLVLLGWILWVGIREKNCLLLSFLAIYILFFWTESVLFVAKGVVPFAFWLCFLMANKKCFNIVS